MTIPTRYRDALVSQSKGALALIESDDGCLLLMAQLLRAACSLILCCVMGPISSVTLFCLASVGILKSGMQ